MSEEYVEPWYVEMQKAAENASPAAIAAKAAADQVYQAQLQKASQPKPSGWFNTDTTLSDPNGRGGRRRSRRSRKSRTRRYRK
jgi:hypothetical protein